MKLNSDEKQQLLGFCTWAMEVQNAEGAVLIGKERCPVLKLAADVIMSSLIAMGKEPASVDEAAAELGINKSRVRQLIQAGDLKAFKQKPQRVNPQGSWLIARNELKRFQKNFIKGAKPSKRKKRAKNSNQP